LARLAAVTGPDPLWVVGGFVRDRLLGRPTHDVDLVLAGGARILDDLAQRIAAVVSGRVVELGAARHRVVRIVAEPLNMELWGLHGTSLAADLYRRDFTINALAWRLPEGPLIDVTGGLEDIGSGVLRAVSFTNLVDDPIRVLRAPRLLAEIGHLCLHPKTLTWLHEAAQGVRSSPQERAGYEVLRSMTAPEPGRALALLRELGLLVVLAPDSASCDDDWCDALPDIAVRLQSCPAAVEVRAVSILAGLLRAWGVPSPTALHELAWPRALLRTALAVATHIDWMMTAATTPGRREVIHALGADTPPAIELAAAAEPSFPAASWRRLWTLSGHELTHVQPVLSAEEICDALGVSPGPRLGAAIRALVRAQARGEVATRDDARAFLGSSRAD
jgi:hypothetical protein